jgi:fructose-bisphosphate aldolase, class II
MLNVVLIIATDTQWAYLTGIRDFVLNKKDYIMTQVGNPEGQDKPNKKVERLKAIDSRIG